VYNSYIYNIKATLKNHSCLKYKLIQYVLRIALKLDRVLLQLDIMQYSFIFIFIMYNIH